MKNMTLERITEVCGGVYYGSEADKKKEIAGAVIDSRQVESGYLFIAVKGEKVDGHQFIPQVFEKGALAVLSEQELSEPAGPYIRVESTLGAMKKLAAYYRRSLDIKVVGITGSVGKTSTKEMIASGNENLLLDKETIPYAGKTRLLQGMKDASLDWRTAPLIAQKLTGSDVKTVLLKDSNHRLGSDSDIAEIRRALDDFLVPAAHPGR